MSAGPSNLFCVISLITLTSATLRFSISSLFVTFNFYFLAVLPTYLSEQTAHDTVISADAPFDWVVGCVCVFACVRLT